MACPPSEVYAHADEQPGEHTDRGSAIHAFLGAVGSMGAAEALAHVPEIHRGAAAAISLEDLATIDPASYAHEVAFALDVATGAARELGRDLGRRYPPLGARELPGTADLVGLSSDGEAVLVGDYKTGRRRLVPARENWQLRILGLAAARAYGRARADVMLIYVHGDVVWYDRASYDAFELESIAGDLADAVGAVRLARDQMERGYAPTPTMGEHCRYCPALRAGSCPAQTSLLHSLAVGPGADLSGALTPEKARDAYRAMRQIDLVVARTWAALHAYATVHPLDLGGGLTFGPRERSRETLDGALARELLRTQFGQEVADEAAEWKVTKKSVGEALRGVAARPVAEGVRAPKISQLERQFFAALAEVGGLRRSVHVEVQEYRVRPTMTSSEDV